MLSDAFVRMLAHATYTAQKHASMAIDHLVTLSVFVISRMSSDDLEGLVDKGVISHLLEGLLSRDILSRSYYGDIPLSLTQLICLELMGWDSCMSHEEARKVGSALVAPMRECLAHRYLQGDVASHLLRALRWLMAPVEVIGDYRHFGGFPFQSGVREEVAAQGCTEVFVSILSGKTTAAQNALLDLLPLLGVGEGKSVISSLLHPLVSLAGRLPRHICMSSETLEEAVDELAKRSKSTSSIVYEVAITFAADEDVKALLGSDSEESGPDWYPFGEAPAGEVMATVKQDFERRIRHMPSVSQKTRAESWVSKLEGSGERVGAQGSEGGEDLSREEAGSDDEVIVEEERDDASMWGAHSESHSEPSEEISDSESGSRTGSKTDRSQRSNADSSKKSFDQSEELRHLYVSCRDSLSRVLRMQPDARPLECKRKARKMTRAAFKRLVKNPRNEMVLFIGELDECTKLVDLLRSCRLITIVKPKGEAVSHSDEGEDSDSEEEEDEDETDLLTEGIQATASAVEEYSSLLSLCINAVSCLRRLLRTSLSVGMWTSLVRFTGLPCRSGKAIDTVDDVVLGALLILQPRLFFGGFKPTVGCQVRMKDESLLLPQEGLVVHVSESTGDRVVMLSGKEHMGRNACITVTEQMLQLVAGPPVELGNASLWEDVFSSVLNLSTVLPGTHGTLETRVAMLLSIGALDSLCGMNAAKSSARSSEWAVGVLLPTCLDTYRSRCYANGGYLAGRAPSCFISEGLSREWGRGWGKMGQLFESVWIGHSLKLAASKQKRAHTVEVIQERPRQRSVVARPPIFSEFMVSHLSEDMPSSIQPRLRRDFSELPMSERFDEGEERQRAIETLESMGFSTESCIAAYERFHDINQAATWLVEHGVPSDEPTVALYDQLYQRISHSQRSGRPEPSSSSASNKNVSHRFWDSPMIASFSSEALAFSSEAAEKAHSGQASGRYSSMRSTRLTPGSLVYVSENEGSLTQGASGRRRERLPQSNQTKRTLQYSHRACIVANVRQGGTVVDVVGLDSASLTVRASSLDGYQLRLHPLGDVTTEALGAETCLGDGIEGCRLRLLRTVVQNRLLDNALCQLGAAGLVTLTEMLSVAEWEGNEVGLNCTGDILRSSRDILMMAVTNSENTVAEVAKAALSECDPSEQCSIEPLVEERQGEYKTSLWKPVNPPIVAPWVRVHFDSMLQASQSSSGRIDRSGSSNASSSSRSGIRIAFQTVDANSNVTGEWEDWKGKSPLQEWSWEPVLGRGEVAGRRESHERRGWRPVLLRSMAGENSLTVSVKARDLAHKDAMHVCAVPVHRPVTVAALFWAEVLISMVEAADAVTTSDCQIVWDLLWLHVTTDLPPECRGPWIELASSMAYAVALRKGFGIHLQKAVFENVLTETEGCIARELLNPREPSSSHTFMLSFTFSRHTARLVSLLASTSCVLKLRFWSTSDRTSVTKRQRREGLFEGPVSEPIAAIRSLYDVCLWLTSHPHTSAVNRLGALMDERRLHDGGCSRASSALEEFVTLTGIESQDLNSLATTIQMLNRLLKKASPLVCMWVSDNPLSSARDPLQRMVRSLRGAIFHHLKRSSAEEMIKACRDPDLPSRMERQEFTFNFVRPQMERDAQDNAHLSGDHAVEAEVGDSVSQLRQVLRDRLFGSDELGREILRVHNLAAGSSGRGTGARADRGLSAMWVVSSLDKDASTLCPVVLPPSFAVTSIQPRSFEEGIQGELLFDQLNNKKGQLVPLPDVMRYRDSGFIVVLCPVGNKPVRASTIIERLKAWMAAGAAACLVPAPTKPNERGDSTRIARAATAAVGEDILSNHRELLRLPVLSIPCSALQMMCRTMKEGERVKIYTAGLMTQAVEQLMERRSSSSALPQHRRLLAHSASLRQPVGQQHVWNAKFLGEGHEGIEGPFRDSLRCFAEEVRAIVIFRAE